MTARRVSALAVHCPGRLNRSRRKPWWILVTGLGLFLSLVSRTLSGQVSFTTVSGSLTESDGSPFIGTLQLGYVPSSLGASIDPQPASIQIDNGFLYILLLPTTDVGSYYLATYTSSSGVVVRREEWQIPISTAPVTPSSVVVPGSTGNIPPTSTTAQTATLPISISEVSSLSSDLASINNSVASISNSLLPVQSTLPTLNTQLSSLQSSITSLSGQSASQSTTLSSVNTNISALSASVASMQTQFGALSTTVNSLSTASATNSTDLATLKGTVNALITTVNGLNQLALSLQSSIVAITQPARFVDAEVPQGTTDGSNLIFSLQQSPAPASSLSLYKNGLLLKQSSDYELNGSTIKFATTGLTPQISDALSASYRY